MSRSRRPFPVVIPSTRTSTHPMTLWSSSAPVSCPLAAVVRPRKPPKVALASKYANAPVSSALGIGSWAAVASARNESSRYAAARSEANLMGL